MEAPKVTPEMLEAEIVSEHYFVASDALQGERTHHVFHDDIGWALGKTQLLTICILQLSNGFTLMGESACVSAANFNEEFGREIARKKAIEKLWPLLGFRLADSLVNPVEPSPEVAKPDPSLPKIGDQVLFYERISTQVSDAMVALITSVGLDSTVGLTVFAPNGTTHARHPVVLLEIGQVPPTEVPYFAYRK